VSKLGVERLVKMGSQRKSFEYKKVLSGKTTRVRTNKPEGGPNDPLDYKKRLHAGGEARYVTKKRRRSTRGGHEEGPRGHVGSRGRGGGTRR